MPKTSDQMVSTTKMQSFHQKPAEKDTSEEEVKEDMHICYICEGANKEGKNLSLAPEKIYSTRYHYASCLYDIYSKVFYEMYDPAEQNKNPDGSPRDILGREVKYNCPAAVCANRRRKFGYKDFAIHQAAEHKGLEQVLAIHPDERVRNLIPKLEEIDDNVEEIQRRRKMVLGLFEMKQEVCELERVKINEHFKTLKRRREGKEFPDMPEVREGYMHICYICNGADDEEGLGKNLSLAPEKIYSTRYHYASCLFDNDSKVFYDMYDPSEINKNPDGSPRDILGREVKYNCCEETCSNMRRKMGYKEFVIHQANEHKGLEQVLENHQEERVRNLIPKLAMSSY